MNTTYFHCYIHTYDNDERASLITALSRVGILSYHESDFLEILARWSSQPADLLILALKDGSLGDVVAQVRKITIAPLMFLLQQTDEDYQIELLNLGVDHIVTRPYSVRLVPVYARNLAQRGRSLPLMQLPKLQAGPLQIDPLTRQVTLGDTPSKLLTAREFQLLYLLYNHQGQILTHEQIIEKIWGWSQPAETGTLRTLVSRIRAKLQIGTATPLKIEHVNGIGYRLRIESQIDN